MATADTPAYPPDKVKATAERLLSQYRALFNDSLQYAAVVRSDYEPGLFDWYDSTGAALAGLGFAVLGDMRPVPAGAKPAAAPGPFLRRFLSADGAVCADAFQMKGAKGEYVRVINLTTELDDRRFVVTSTAPRRWNTPGHQLAEHAAPETPVGELHAQHRTRLAGLLAAGTGVATVQARTLDDVLASENRSLAETAAFRRRQGAPDIGELVRLGAEPTFAALVHAELRRLAFPDEKPPAPAGVWQVAEAALPAGKDGPLGLEQLVAFALDQGMAQVSKVGSRLNPFLVLDSGRAFFFICTAGDADPMAIALRVLRDNGDGSTCCTLVLDTRITLEDGDKHDAIVAMAAHRAAPEGQTWAQRYRPKSLLRSFKAVGDPVRVAACRNLYTEAVSLPASHRVA